MNSTAETQRTLVVASSADPIVPMLLQQLGMACRNAKLALDTFDLEASSPSPILHNYSSILLVCPRTIDTHQDLLNLLDVYVRGGGGLVVVSPQDNPIIGKLCGIRDFVSRSGNTIDTQVPEVTTFLVDLFPAIEGLRQQLMAIIGSAPHILDDAAEVEIVATSSSNMPLAWRRNHDDGRVFVWNILLAAQEWGRSLLVQSILSVQKIAVKGIANVGMLQIDDFPASYPNLAREPAQSEFDMPVLEFLDKVWLPDMLQIADKYGIPYSFALPFNYNEITTKPFDFEEWEAETICDGGEVVSYGVYFARKISAQHELCLHGYNHIPLLIENWGSRQAMIDSIQAALGRWTADGLGVAPTSYVAPMNEYDRDGVLALKECLPLLKVICTERSNKRDRGGREFEPEPWNRDLFCLPRLTDGYQMTESSKVTMLSAMAEMGVWTHFVHADDIFDIHADPNSDFPPRNPDSCGWRDVTNGALKDEFEQWLEFVKQNFPWLRYLNATQAGEQIQSHLTNKLEVVIGDDEIELRSDIPAFVQLRIDRQRGGAARKSLATGDHPLISLLHQYQGATYSLCTLQIPAGTSKLKLV